MKEHLVLKNYIKTRIREYIFLILTATILLIFLEKKSFSQENIFIIDEVEVSGRISTDFNREKFINMAFKAHKIIGCRGVTRSDFKFFKGKFYLLEINTQPGMTKLSLVPEIAAHYGISFKKLIEWILKDASKKK